MATILHQTTSTDVFLAKFDVNGNVLWAKEAVQASATSHGAAYSVTADKWGNAYITGQFNDTISFGTHTLRSANNDVYTVKYDANGNVKWAAQSFALTPASYGGYGYSVTTDKWGNACITGLFNDTLTFGAYTLKTVVGCDYNVFLVKYDTAGKVLWATQPASVSNGRGAAYSVITDNAGAAYIAGYFQDSIIFGSYKLSAYVSFGIISDMFLAKYDVGGNVVWAEQSYNNDSIRKWEGYSLAADTLNNIYMSAGSYSPGNGKVRFGKDTFSYTNNNPDPALILKLDTAGNVKCGTIIPTGGESNNTVAVTKSGQYIYLGGGIADTVAFGKDTFNVPGSGYPFIASWLPCNPVLAEVNNIDDKKGAITVYPNPSNGIVQLEITNYELGMKNTIEVYNVLGERVYSQSSILNSPFSINLKDSPAGVYFIRVYDEGQKFSAITKIIIE